MSGSPKYPPSPIFEPDRSSTSSLITFSQSRALSWNGRSAVPMFHPDAREALKSEGIRICRTSLLDTPAVLSGGELERTQLRVVFKGVNGGLLNRERKERKFWVYLPRPRDFKKPIARSLYVRGTSNKIASQTMHYADLESGRTVLSFQSQIELR